MQFRSQLLNEPGLLMSQLGILRNNLSETFGIWTSVLIMVLLPLDLLYHIDAFILNLTPAELILDIAVVIVFMAFMALFFSMLANILSLAGHKLFKVRADGILALNNVIAWIFLVNVLIILTSNWLAHVTGLRVSTLKGVTVGLWIAGLVGSFRFRNEIKSKIRPVLVYSARAASVLILLSALVVSGKALWLHFNHYGFSASESRSFSSILRKKPPNIVLITFDALRAGSMSLYGYERNTTPNINDLAEHSFVFNYAYSNCSFTTPSILSILTGQYPSTHRGFRLNYSLPDHKKRENLAHVLRLADYKTAAVVSNTKAHPWHNGTFADFEFLPPPTFKENHKFRLFANLVTFHLVELGSKAYIWLEDLAEYFRLFKPSLYLNLFTDQTSRRQVQLPNPPELTFQAARSYLKSARAPFFLWIHVFPPHDPYLPSEPFKHTFLKDKVLETLNEQDVYLAKNYAPEHQPEIDKLRSRYDEHILYADHYFGQFMADFRKSGFFENSIIIVTSDHGESFEKGYQGHGGNKCRYLYQSLIHVPLVIHLPNQSVSKRIGSNAESIDIAPSILDFVGLNIPSWMEGESLKPAVEGAYNSSKPKFSMDVSSNKRTGPLTKGTFAVFKDEFKYIYYLDVNREELYRPKDDPEEICDFSSRYREKANEMKELIFRRILDIEMKPASQLRNS